jgi:hypothetical protein
MGDRLTARYTHRMADERIVLNREAVQKIIRAVSAVENLFARAQADAMAGYGIAMNLAIIRMTLNPELASSQN